MTTVKTYQLAGDGTVVPTVVECLIQPGIGIHMTGAPCDKDVKECLLRVVTALQSAGFHIPGKKIVLNISPVASGHAAALLDSPVAMAILSEAGRCAPCDDELCIAGELGLDGSARYSPELDMVKAFHEKCYPGNEFRLLIPRKDRTGGPDRFFNLTNLISLAAYNCG